MGDYTPTDPHVKQGYVRARMAYGDDEHSEERRVAAAAEFDRWFNSVKAEAWDELYSTAYSDTGNVVRDPSNPYREQP